MAKRIYEIYYNASIVKSDADIPAQADMTVTANYVDCSNIKLSEVKTLLGVAAFNLSDCCTSAAIKKWAAFRPGSFEGPAGGGSDWVPTDITDTPIYVQTWPGGTIADAYKLGEFAGYNHDEVNPPTYYDSGPTTPLSYETGKSIDISFSLARGARLSVPSYLLYDTDWDHMAIEYYKDAGAGYSLDDTVYPVDLDTMPIVKTYTSQPAGTNWNICIRPCYINATDDVTVEGIMEDGPRVVALSWTTLQIECTVFSMDSTYRSLGNDYFECSFTLERITRSDAIDIGYIRLYMYDESGEIVPPRTANAVPSSQIFTGLADSHNFTSTIIAHAEVVDTTDAKIVVQISMDNATWQNLGTYGPYTVHTP
jgi:hypothetical protein